MVPGALVTRDSVPLMNPREKALRVFVLPLLLCGQNSAFALDLNSTSRTVPAPLGGASRATVVVGGRAQVVNAGQLVTPAEAVAIGQIAASGRQNLVVGTAGNAVGGSFNLGGLPAGLLSGLNIPRTVTAVNDFGNAALIDVKGSLTNSGSIFAFSTNAAQSMATIAAQNIVNTTSGIISSITPRQFLPANALSKLDLNLQSVGNVINEGTISSSGSLTIRTTDGTIRNAGLLYAQNGDVNLRSSSTSELLVDNRNGVVQALAGNINVTAPNLPLAGTVNLVGGDWLSNQLNLSAAKGELRGSLGEVNGWVNIKASAANFGAATSNLKLESITTDGDPTYFNSLGSLTLANLPNTAGAALALLASQDVIVTSGVIDTTNHNGGNGGALTIIAGANFVTVGSNTTGDTTTTVSLSQSALATHGSVTGGAIDLSGVTAINTNGTFALNAAGFRGGDINLVAFGGTGIGSTRTPGSINLGTTGSIVTVGAGGTNGDILVVAGAAADPAGSSAVILPAMFTGWAPMNSQSGTSGGNVTITTATPFFSGNINIRNGAILGTSGTITGGATLLPTSVLIGSQGGTNNGTIPQSSSLTQWQIDAANYALSEINAFRASADGHNQPPLVLDPMLMKVATADAQYMAQTQHFAHVTLNGGTMTDRYKAAGINVFAIGNYGENIGYRYGTGNTAKQSFDYSESYMEAEEDGPFNHRYNLTHYGYVGIGFASVGNAFYIVENFSDSPPPVTTPNLVTPAYGGIQGGAGMVAVSPTNNTLPAIGSSGVLPTSINTAGAGITINAGAKLTANGALLTNGISDPWQFPAPGDAGGPVNITAGGDVTLFGIQATGGMGGAALQGEPNSNGGAGGNVSVTSLNGSINILPGAPCAPCLAIATSGGAGGQAIDSNRNGGSGGAAGNITLNAPNGSISLTAIDAGGGGGSGGSGGASAGTGGAGGAGGQVNLTALNSINVSYYINASGGGGGGAGGAGTGGGGGGGGAALAMAGAGGGSGGSGAGGGGAGMSELPGYGGPSSNFLAVSGPAGQNGSSGTGGAAGLFGGGGGGGVGTGAAASNAGAGGGMGQAGASNGSSTISGGAAGAGGAVTIDANSLQMLGTPASFWTRFTTTAAGNNSILALGTNGSVNISTAGSATTVLNPNANYASTTKNITVDLSSSLGNIVAGSQPGSITLNGNPTNSPFNGGVGGGSSITITENNAQVTLNNGATVTPAEWAAILQMRTTGTQTIQLDASGTAIGGTLTLLNTNIPTGGFSTLVVPVGLTLVNNVPSLTYSAGVTINGIFDASAQTGAATVFTPSLTINGSIIGSGGGLTFQSTVPTFPVTVGANASIHLKGGTISGTTLNIVNSASPISLPTSTQLLNVNSTGDISIANTGSLQLGTIAAPNFAVTAAPSATITTTKNITTGTLSLTAASIINNNVLSGSQINLVGNNTTGDFTVGGTGTFTPTATTSFITTVGNLAFAPNSNLTLNGKTVITANGPSQGISFGTGAALTNNGQLFLITSSVLGSLPISGNAPTMISAVGKGTIANPNGDVVLPVGFTFIGSDLAILASGNIRATGATTLNLSNSKGKAGDLTLIAGYNVLGNASDPSYKIVSTGLYTIDTPNPAGGSIYLPKAAINLSSTALNGVGGNLIAVANGGSTESGMIALGAINTSAAKGTAGSVTIIGEGGIHTGAINASGSTGGTVSLAGAAPVIPAGAVSIGNGTLSNGAAITHGAVNATNGAAILVSGAINTNGLKNQAGDITLLSDAQIGVTGAITANGLQTTSARAGGNINIDAGLDVKVKAISTNGLAAASATATGDAGIINITAGSMINTGALQALGAKNTGTGIGGKGGTINLSTQKILVGATPVGIGSIKVTGAVDARGGDASKTLGADGGAGGAVTLDAGAVAVTSSVNASGGLKGKTGVNGADGSLAIDTYAIQSLPTSFDLTSSTRNVVAVPGSLFTLGTASTPNGVGGTITVGTNVVDKKQHALITSTSGTTGSVSVTVHGAATGLLNNLPLATFDATTGKRTLVTPGEAVALYQTTHAGNAIAQTLTLATNGSLLPPTPTAILSISSTELNSVNFTAFKQPAGVSLSLQGVRPVLNLPSSAVLGGTIDFPTANSVGYINAGAGAFNLQSTGSITSASTVILSGTNGTWTNNGKIQVGTLVLARPTAAAMTFINGPGSQINATARLSPTVDVGMTMKFKADATSQFNMPITFGAMPMPAIYAAASTAQAANASTARNVSLTFDMPSFTPTVGGTANVSSIKLTSLNTTPLHVADGASLTAAKTIAITAASGPITIDDGIAITSGVLATEAPDWTSTTLLTTKQIASAGGITIKSSGTVTIGSNNTLIANGGNQSITSTAGNVSISNNNRFLVMGGNLTTLAAGTVTGGNGNSFQAKGTTTGANGGIEVGAGTTTSTLASAFAKKGGTQIGVATLNAAGLTNITQNKGALVVNPLSTGSATIAPTSSINMSYGAVVFDFLAPGSGVNLGTTTFETRAAKPVGYSEASTDFVVETQDDI